MSHKSFKNAYSNPNFNPNPNLDSNPILKHYTIIFTLILVSSAYTVFNVIR